MHQLWEGLSWALGLDTVSPRDYNLLQSCLRALVVYVAGMAVLRIGEHRSVRRGGIFDVVLAFILGSVLSRAINGTATLLPTVGVTVVLVGLHRLIAAAAFHSHGFGSLVKGDASLLVEDGEVRSQTMRRYSISQRDLEEGLHLHEMSDVGQVREAWIERNGDISAVPRPKELRVVEVEVEAGVQRIRIELG